MFFLKRKFYLLFLLLFSLFFLSCQFDSWYNSSSCSDDKKDPLKNRMPRTADPEPFPMDSKPLLIRGAKVMTASGKIYPKAFLLLEKGLIKKISEEEIKVSPETLIIEGEGTVVTPGVIDVHSHMGVYSNPFVRAHYDGNEANRPVTADIWAEHGFWPQDPSLWRALAGGITTIQVLPGSANLIGGRSFTAKLIPKLSAREMRFPGAPQGLKMACGENPKRVHNDKGPSTRMGVIAGFRKAFQKALEYNRKWVNQGSFDGEGRWKPKDKKKPGMPERDFVSETLSEVIKGNILVHVHCYRADDLSAMLDLAEEFHFKIRSFQHGLEAYKIRHRLAKEEVAVASWADWWGFKAEAFDGIPQGLALLEDVGVRAIVHSDSPIDVQYLNVEAGKALVAGRRLGLNITEDEALKWITKNPAWSLGIEDKVGSIEEGKMADLVVWDGHPFSVYTKTRFVIINGRIVFDRQKKLGIKSDFEVGQNNSELFDGREFRKTVTTKELKYPDPDKNKKSEFHPTGQSFLVKNVNYLQPSGKWQYGSIKVHKGLITAVIPGNQDSNEENSGALQGNPEDIKEDSSIKNPGFIDAKGLFLTPGLIDPSTQLGLLGITMEPSTYNHLTEVAEATPNNRAVDALNLKSLRIPIARQGGITTVIARPVGYLVSGTGVAFDLHKNSQYVESSIALFGQIGKSNFGFNRELGSNSVSMQWRELRRIVDDVLSFSKAPDSYEKGNSRKYFLPKGDMKAMLPVLRGRIPWVVKINRASDIKILIGFKKELNKLGLKPRFVLEQAMEAALVASMLKKHGIPVILQPSQMTNWSFETLETRADTAAVLSEKGVQVMFSSLLLGAFDGHITRLRQEAGVAVKYGMSVDKARKALTKVPAEVFGISGRGELVVGTVANLVLWSGDPLESTSWVEKLWIGGEDIRLEDRQSLLAEKYKDF